MSITADPVTGALIVGEILRADADIASLVPAKWIKAGALPGDIELPAILIRQISSIAKDGLQPGIATPTVDRIAVLVRAKHYRDQGQLIRLIKAACHGRRGGFDTGVNFSVRSAGTGPDLRGPANSFEQTQDFRVFTTLKKGSSHERYHPRLCA